MSGDRGLIELSFVCPEPALGFVRFWFVIPVVGDLFNAKEGEEAGRRFIVERVRHRADLPTGMGSAFVELREIGGSPKKKPKKK